MSKFTEFIDNLSDDELEWFEKDLRNGSIQKLVDQKKEYFKIKDKKCSVCGNNVTEECLVLIYGDPKLGIRKKAHFCGTDCMEYFTNKNIRNIPNTEIKKTSATTLKKTLKK
jgi:hypothetical protein